MSRITDRRRSSVEQVILTRLGGCLSIVEQLGDNCEQLIVVPRLLHERLGPCLEGALLVGITGAAGYHDYRRDRDSRIYPESLQHHEAIACRQTQIQNDQVRPICASLADGT